MGFGDEKSLPTRFGRRLFLSFLLVAAVPVGLVTLYALGYFSKVFVQQHEDRLFDAVRSQGHLVLERLQHADRLIRSNPGLLAAESPVFSSIEPIEFSGKTPQLAVDIFQPEPVAFIYEHAGQNYRAAVDSQFLWGGLVTVPAGIQLCFYSSEGDVLRCEIGEGALDPIQLASLAPSDYQSTFSMDFEEEKYFAAAWELFLGADFGARDWNVIGFERARAATEPFALKNFLPSLVVLSLSMAALVALFSLRKRLQPFSALVEATRRMSKSDFSTPVNIQTSDELQLLGQSFNEMMSRLGGQMKRMQVDSDVDRMILDSASVASVLDLVLENGFRYVDCDWLCIGLIDPANPEIVLVQQAEYGEETQLGVSRITLGKDSRQQIENANVASVLSDQENQLVQLLARNNEQNVFLVNVVWNQVLLGFIALQSSQRQGLDSEMTRQLAELRDRVTLTLSASEKEKALFQQAHFDALTNLPNRYLLVDRMRQQCSRGPSHPFAVLFLDLDRFKNINDSLGHSVGDELLKKVAVRLSEMFPEPNTVARLGGDEFVIILTDIVSPAAVSEKASELLESLSRRLSVGSNDMQVAGSVGIALYPGDGLAPEDLLRNADAAMYQSKDSGRGRSTFFTPAINAAVTARFTIEAEIRKALKTNGFDVVFQPQRSLSESRIVGLEALVRWPQSGYGPGEFIPVAEDTGLIVELGNWVLDAACRVYAGIPEAVRPPQFSVNVSVRECEQDDFVKQTMATLRRHGLPPDVLEIEITESVLVDGVSGVKRAISRLSEAGISIALDDFGTGYSSLKYLQEMPVDVIKIDRSFVIDLDADERQRAFIETVVDLARRLGMTTVAEGAETGPEFQALRHLGCDSVQGYFFSRPIHQSELVEFLEEFRRATSGTDEGAPQIRSVT